MDSSFTQDLSKLEEYSLSMIDFIEKLPDSFFDCEELTPSKGVIDNIINYSKKTPVSYTTNNKVYRYSRN
ncbi:hypothetical protein [Labilibacter marinus]|uniref:hypothetical protein n=1 Tax=Labilibacter marinus TaxID=1477105 RepID=UPI00082B71E4|nr:hypothetical protein [Labilibacter marinus]